MKMTNKRVREIINEEVKSVLSEGYSLESVKEHVKTLAMWLEKGDLDSAIREAVVIATSLKNIKVERLNPPKPAADPGKAARDDQNLAGRMGWNTD